MRGPIKLPYKFRDGFRQTFLLSEILSDFGRVVLEKMIKIHGPAEIAA